MKDLLRIILLFGLVLCCTAAARPDHPQTRNKSAVIGSEPRNVATTNKPPLHDHPPQLTQGKHDQLSPRIESPAKAVLTTDLPPLQYTLIYLPADPLVSRFTQGVYLRYRPRDPTSM